MPSKYTIRNFTENCYYHVFNRGVEKRNIFLDQQDYRIFLYYLFLYCSPLDKILRKYPLLPPRLQSKNLHDEVNIISYCFMPNHFHLLLQQLPVDGISKLLRRLEIAYASYFNQKYQRVGALFQGRFKAALIETDELLIHISRYIHLNPLVVNIVDDLKDYQWSSYKEYISEYPESICTTESVLANFSTRGDYEKYVLDQVEYARSLEQSKHLLLDA